MQKMLQDLLEKYRSQSSPANHEPDLTFQVEQLEERMMLSGNGVDGVWSEFEEIGVPGSMVYRTAVSDSASSGQIDVFGLEIQSGQIGYLEFDNQSLGVVWNGSIQVLDQNEAIVFDSGNIASSGDQTFEVFEFIDGGNYSFSVATDSLVSDVPFCLSLTLNALPEPSVPKYSLDQAVYLDPFFVEFDTSRDSFKPAIANVVDGRLSVGGPAGTGSQDWYQVDVQKGESITIVGEELRQNQFTGQLSDIGIRLYNSNEELITEAGILPGNTTRDVSGKIVANYVAQSDESIFVRVTNNSLQATYSLTILKNVDYENLDNVGYQGQLSPPILEPIGPTNSILGMIESNGDRDVFRISVEEGDELTFRTHTPFDSVGDRQNNLDPTLSLTYYSSVLATSDNDAADGKNAYLTYTAESSSTIWVSVRSANSSSQGEYILEIDGLSLGNRNIELSASPRADEKVRPDEANDFSVFSPHPFDQTTIEASDLLVDGQEAISFEIKGPSWIEFTLPDLAPGIRSVTMSEGAILDIQGNNLSVNSSFEIDIVGPRIVSSSIQEGDTIQPDDEGNLVVRIQFDEDVEFDESNLELFNVATQQVFAPVDVNVFSYQDEIFDITFSNIPGGTYQFKILSGETATRDSVGNALDGEATSFPIGPEQSGDGNPGGDFLVEFEWTGVPFLLDETLIPIGPDGAMISSGQFTGDMAPATPGRFELFLDTGNSASLVFSPTDSSILAEIAIQDVDGFEIAKVRADSAGQSFEVVVPAVAQAGMVTIMVSAISGEGNFVLTTTKNAVTDLFDAFGTEHNSFETAKELNRYEVEGIGESGWFSAIGASGQNDHYYQVELRQGEFHDIVFTTNNSGQIGLYDQNQTLLAIDDYENEGQSGIRNFKADYTGTYYVRITDEQSSNYSLVVTRGISFNPSINRGELENAGYIGPMMKKFGDVGERSGFLVKGNRLLDPLTGETIETLPASLPGATTKYFTSINSGLTYDNFFETSLRTGEVTRSFGRGFGIDNYNDFAFLDGKIYALTDDGIRVFDYATGEYETNLTGSLDVEDIGSFSIAASDSGLYLLDDSRLYMVNTTTGTRSFRKNLALESGVATEIAIVGDELFVERYGRNRIDVYSGFRFSSFERSFDTEYSTLGGLAGDGRQDTHQYYFEAEVDATITVSTNISPSELDPIAPVRVFDAEGSLLVPAGDTLVEGNKASRQFLIPTTGRYFVQINGVDVEGNYQLQIEGIVPTEFAFEATELTAIDGTLRREFPEKYRLRVNDSLLLSTVQASDLKVNGQAARSVDIIDANTIEFDISNTENGDGQYTIEFSSNSILSVSQIGIESGTSQFEFDSTGPRVEEVQWNVNENGFMTDVVLFFDDEVAPSSFDITDIGLTGPDADSADDPDYYRDRVQSITVDGQQAKITFSNNSISTVGTYELTVGSDFLDLAGNLSDHNQDGIQGDANDVFTNQFLLSKPDLVVTSASVSGNIVFGNEIQVSWTVTNQGGEQALEGWTDSIFLSTDNVLDSQDTLLGRFAIDIEDTAIGDLIDRVQTIQLPVDDQFESGVYYLLVETESNNDIPEADELNNVSFMEIAAEKIPLANLQVKEVSGPTTAFSGQEIVVSWIVENNGTGSTDSNGWSDGVWLSDDQTLDQFDTFLGSAVNSSFLDAGYSYSNSITTTLPTTIEGTFYFIVKADRQDQVLELSGNDDNEAFSELSIIELPPLPDLEVGDVSTAFAKIFSGTTVNISWTVTNAGGGDTFTSRWTDSVYLSDDEERNGNDLFLGQFERRGVLQVGDSYTGSLSVDIPIELEGDFFIIVETDSSDNVFESAFEGNNEGIESVSIVQTPPPDIEIESITIPTSASSGKSIDVELTLVNNGSSSPIVSRWSNSVYLSQDQEFDQQSDIFLGDINTILGSFGAGGGSAQAEITFEPGDRWTGTRSFAIPNEIEGDYFVIVVGDVNEAVFEFDTDNNIGASSNVVEIVSTPPDLRLSSLSAPQTITNGTTIEVQWNVENVGVGDTIVSRWVDEVFISDDEFLDANDRIVGSFEFRAQQPLDSNSSYQMSEFITIPVELAGDYYLFVRADGDQQIFDSDRDNNDSNPLSISIEQATSNLIVTMVEGPTTVNAGDNIQVSWIVENGGAVPTNNSWWQDRVYLSTDQSIDGSDILLGTVIRSNSLDSGESYNRDFAFDAPEEIQGDFFFLVQTDATNRVFESDENDNVGVSTAPTTVILNEVPDLEWVEINVPDRVYSGQQFDLSYSLQNSGADTKNKIWDSYFYLSLDQFLEVNNDIYIGSERQSDINADEVKTYTSTFRMPAGRSGNYYVFAIVDGGNSLNERDGESNNLFMATDPISVELLPPADLVAGLIDIPDDSLPGETATVRYSVTNNGPGIAAGTWFDSVYLSTDSLWDIDDKLLGRFQVQSPDGLSPGESYEGEVTNSLPGVLPGAYQVIVRSDIRNAIPENNEENNLSASVENFDIAIPEILESISVNGSLNFGQQIFYRFEVPESNVGEALVFNLDVNNQNSNNELYVRFGEVPTRSEFGFGFSDARSSSQRAVIPTTQAGTYYVMVLGDPTQTAGSIGNYSLVADYVEFTVFNESFGQGGTAGNRTIEIDGVKFDRSVTAHLIAENGDEIEAIRYYRSNSTKLFATFDLTDVATGIYDVEIKRSSSNEVLLVEQGLEVVPAVAAELTTQFSAPSQFRRTNTISLVPVHVGWSNGSLNDIESPLVLLTASEKFSESQESALANDGENSLIFLADGNTRKLPGVLLPGETGSNTFYLSARPISGGLTNISYNFTSVWNDEGMQFDFESDVFAVNNTYSIEQTQFKNLQSSYYESLNNTVGELKGLMTSFLSSHPEYAVYDFDVILRNMIEFHFNNYLYETTGGLKVNLETNDHLQQMDEISLALFSGRNLVSRLDVTQDGEASFPALPIGEYSLQIEGASFLNQAVQIVVIEDSSNVNRNFSIKEGAEFYFELVSQNADLVSDAYFEIEGVEESVFLSGKADSLGKFKVVGLPEGEYLVKTSALGYRDKVSTISITENSARVIRIAAEASGTLSGVVFNQDRGIPNVFLRLENLATNETATFFSGDDGIFTKSGLAEGTWTLTASHPSFRSNAVTELSIFENEITTQSVELSTGARISGRLVDADGELASNVTLTLTDEDQNKTLVTTSNDGTFLFGGIEPGVFIIGVEIADFWFSPREVTVVQGEFYDIGDIDVLDRKNLQGVLRDKIGKPIPNAKIAIIEATTGIDIVLGTTGSDGSFNIGSLPPTGLNVVFRADGFKPEEYYVELPDAGQPSFELFELIDYQIRVANIDGSALSKANLIVRERAGDFLLFQELLVDDATPLLAFPNGVFDISVTTEDGRSATQTITTQPGEGLVEVDLFLPDPYDYTPNPENVTAGELLEQVESEYQKYLEEQDKRAVLIGHIEEHIKEKNELTKEPISFKPIDDSPVIEGCLLSDEIHGILNEIEKVEKRADKIAKQIAFLQLAYDRYFEVFDKLEIAFEALESGQAAEENAIASGASTVLGIVAAALFPEASVPIGIYLGAISLFATIDGYFGDTPKFTKIDNGMFSLLEAIKARRKEIDTKIDEYADLLVDELDPLLERLEQLVLKPNAIPNPFDSKSGPIYQRVSGDALGNIRALLERQGVGLTDTSTKPIATYPDEGNVNFHVWHSGNYRVQATKEGAYTHIFDLFIECKNEAGEVLNEKVRGSINFNAREITEEIAQDPNDILGPEGFGEQKYVTASQTLDYTIRFENDPELATASAQTVRITQQLDPDLDFRTFRIGNFAIGSTLIEVERPRSFLAQRVDLVEELGIFVDVIASIDVQTGEAFWEFTSIDPETGEFVTDPRLGFLPPNLTSPDGEGFVTYSIRPRSDVESGAVIDAEARIIFDFNPPIDTPPIFNTIDAGVPTSSVSVERTDEVGIFNVRWTASDDENGSGLAGLTVYVSEDGGPATAWLTNSTLASASFVGKAGSRYSFYSVATDNAGNDESRAITASATIEIPGIKIVAADDLQTSEDGDTTSFTIVLETAPSSDVVIPISSSNSNEGNSLVEMLTFTTENWDVPQTVIIFGADDFVDDGDQEYSIQFGPILSDDLAFDGLVADEIVVSNLDDDDAGFEVSQDDELATSEGGATDEFLVRLTSQPISDVIVGLTSNNENEGMPTISSISFTSENWDQPQTVEVLGQDDDAVDGDVAYAIEFLVESDDVNYDGIGLDPVTVINRDNDSVSFTAVIESISTDRVEGGTIAFVGNVADFGGDTSELTFTWDFGDGNSAAGVEVDHAYADDGDYEVELTVTDQAGQSTSVSQSLMIANQAPVFIFLSSSNPDVETQSVDGQVTLSGGLEDAGVLDSHTVMIDWGDGSPVQTLADVDPNTRQFSADHQYAGAGNYEISVSVVDNYGDSTAEVAPAVVGGIGVVDGTLFIVGTGESDSVRVDNRRGQLRVRVRTGRQRTQSFVFDLADVNAIDVKTGEGSDFIRINRIGAIPVTIDAGEGDNRVDIRASGMNFITTGLGNDRIQTSGGENYIDAGDGNNSIRSRSGTNFVTTGNGNDDIRLGNGDHVVDAGDGNNRVTTGRGNDHITTGAGNDSISAGDGDNSVYAGAGNDSIRTGRGADMIFAEQGNDYVRAGRGDDVVSAGDGNDIIRGERGRDVLIGGRGSDAISKDRSEDVLIAGYTEFDADPEALIAIRLEWSSNSSFESRVANLQNGTGEFLGSDTKLMPFETVLDDQSIDFVLGRGRQSYLFVSSDPLDGDFVYRINTDDLIEELGESSSLVFKQ